MTTSPRRGGAGRGWVGPGAACAAPGCGGGRGGGVTAPALVVARPPPGAVAGVGRTRERLDETVPIHNGAQVANRPDRTFLEWDKDDIDALRMLKVDVLALGIRTAIRKSFDLIERHYGRALTLATVPAEDAGVYEML